MRISDWSSDVCSSDLPPQAEARRPPPVRRRIARRNDFGGGDDGRASGIGTRCRRTDDRAPLCVRHAARQDRLGRRPPMLSDRKHVGEGKTGAVRVSLDGTRTIKKKKQVNYKTK